jgi:hypothetical protein
MQLAKLTAAWSVWAEGVWLAELDSLGEFAPQAAIIVAVAIAAAATGRREVVLNMAQVYPVTGHTTATRPRRRGALRAGRM